MTTRQKVALAQRRQGAGTMSYEQFGEGRTALGVLRAGSNWSLSYSEERGKQRQGNAGRPFREPELT